MQFSISDYPHRRYNLLTGEWVLVSPHRTKRPWQGKQEPTSPGNRPSYNPECYLCPENIRANRERNPKYSSTYVFTNDFAALLPNTPDVKSYFNPLMQSESLQGICRVMCFSPRHDLTLAEMSVEEIQSVVDIWADQINELGKRYRWVQIFENKGEMMGCSNPHPHGQVWAGTALPNEPFKEDQQQFSYFKENGSVLLTDYLKLESEQGITLALALTENYLKNSGRRGACRVHGGGFAGTIQVFMPKESLDGYLKMIKNIFGEKSVEMLSIRPIGSIHLNAEL